MSDSTAHVTDTLPDYSVPLIEIDLDPGLMNSDESTDEQSTLIPVRDEMSVSSESRSGLCDRMQHNDVDSP